MMIVTLTVDAASFPQGAKELIATDLQERFGGVVRVTDVRRVEAQQTELTGWREHCQRDAAR